MRKFKYLFLIVLLMCFTVSCGMAKNALNKNKPANITVDGTEKLYVHQNGNYSEYADAYELTDKATLIFSGAVDSKRCELLDIREVKTGELPDEEKILYTLYEISVDKVYKGQIDNEKICVKVSGGELEKGRYIYTGETVNLDIKSKYLFLASDHNNEYPNLINANQSVYSMDNKVRKKDIFAVNNSTGITLSEILNIVDK